MNLKEKIMKLSIAMILVAFLPYPLFGKHKKIARSVAVLNGFQISLACAFLEPLFLIANPFLALFAISPIWKR